MNKEDYLCLARWYRLRVLSEGSSEVLTYLNDYIEGEDRDSILEGFLLRVGEGSLEEFPSELLS